MSVRPYQEQIKVKKITNKLNDDDGEWLLIAITTNN